MHRIKAVTLLSVLALFPFLVKGADTVKFLDYEGNINESLAIGAGATASGISSLNGIDFYMIEQTNDTIQQWKYDNGAFYGPLMTISMPTVLYYDPWGITEDEAFLYVGVDSTSGGVPETFASRILQFAKSDGSFVAEPLTQLGRSTLLEGLPRDLATDGMRIFQLRTDGSVTPATHHIDWGDTSNNVRVQTVNIAQTLACLAFYNKDFVVYRNTAQGQLRILDPDGVFITAGINTNVTPTGCTSMHFNNVQSPWTALIHR